jgi:hypothetical protein
MKKIIITILVMLLFTCSLLLGDTKEKLTEKITDDKGKLVGKVTDKKGEPVSKANILIEETKFSTQSKKDGTYVIKHIPPGKYDVICRSSGFKTVKITDVIIESKITTMLNFNLTRLVEEVKETHKTTIKKEGEETRSGEKGDIDELLESTYEPEMKIKGTTTSPTTKDKEIRSGTEEEVSRPVEEMGVSDTKKDDSKEVIDTIEKTTLETYKSKVKASSYSGLRAGFVDDNKQFNYFLNFLAKYRRRVVSLPIHITEEKLESGLSYADGRYLFFPTEYDKKIDEYRLEVEYSGITEEVMIYRQGKRELDISIANIQKALADNIPLDILFVLDTTGSMGEEIERLRNSIEIINLNISEISPSPDIRYGLVLYRDISDAYNTKVIPLNDSLSEFQRQLSTVVSGGGGDGPENLQAALEDALTKITWRKNGVRLAFIITDAPPHLDYEQDYTYVNAVHDAKRKGVKLFSIGTGGLPLSGEYVLRQISQYTFANYVFLTYGEKGESEGGAPGSVSHHTGENFQTDKLEAIIIRKVKEELHNYLGKPLSGGDEYLQATKIDDEENKVTLEKLFGMAITQLSDYSSMKIPDNTPAVVLPIMCSKDELKVNAEYFTANLLFAFSQAETFKAIERDDLQKIIEEQKLQLTGLTDLNKAVKVGKIVGADMLIAGELFEKEECFELYVKLLNVKTAEVLSITKTKIDKSLGL